ncbi:SDR family NAD(P)-dependent oxidoreductase [Streptomyces meridianus]|uniref:SDR family oxidoreductase n=1 Tax=Streptomyces meridianus TaxID=2938945 RepID=A0ABT0X1S0_9ACTN|nr:SDR family oxidoreductase [Streptomyces meridianus]MCM2576473.1 SDR family oxidoreductase [Streptomyces meridianus]
MSRTVVISGGGTGIGLAAARTFAEDGNRIVLIGRRPEVLERAAAGINGAVGCPADLSDPEQAERAARFVCEEFGAVDVLINSAGGNGGLEPGPEHPDGALTGTAHDWTVNFRLNTLTAVLLTEALFDHLASPGGRLLFLGSIAARRGSGSGAYAASKAALHPYAFDLARRLGPRGITVNVVAPGYIEDTDFFGDGLPEERRRALAEETLIGRAGVPGDVAATLHWLASHAAGHITSQVIHVNGGAERGN